GGIAFYPDPDIRLAISRTIAIETPRGIRLAKDKSSHKIDVIIATAMAAQAAVTGQRETTIPCRIVVGLHGLLSSNAPIDDADAHYREAEIAAKRGELKGSDLLWFYKERAKRMGASR